MWERLRQTALTIVYVRTSANEIRCQVLTNMCFVIDGPGLSQIAASLGHQWPRLASQNVPKG